MGLINQLRNHVGGAEHAILEENGQIRPPSEEELKHEIAAPGEDATLPLGILYSADWKTYGDGMARHAREQVKALALAGLPIHLQPIGTRLQLRDELKPEVLEVEYLENVTFSRTAITIRHLVMHNPEVLLAHVLPRSVRALNTDYIDRVCRSTIVYTSWERDCAHPQFIEVLKRIGQLWVPCEANKRAFVSSGMPQERVKVVPYPYNPVEHNIAHPRGREELPAGKRFYNIGKWEPRKNQHQLLGSFLKAYTPKDRASLLIKASGFRFAWEDYPTVEESVHFWLSNPVVRGGGWDEQNFKRLVRIIQERVSDADIKEIHRRNNIYVSPSCGEAWDIPAFEAKLAGNRLVHTGFGGSEDYATAEDLSFEYSMEPVHRGYRWEPEAKWAHPTNMSEVLRTATAPDKRICPPDYYSKFSQFAVGLLMRQNVEELARELGCWEELSTVGCFG